MSDARPFPDLSVGRTTFWEPLVNFRAQKIARETAVAQIAASYKQWVDVFEAAKRGIGTESAGHA
jgi:myo-inositol catabolism protein IolC